MTFDQQSTAHISSPSSKDLLLPGSLSHTVHLISPQSFILVIVIWFYSKMDKHTLNHKGELDPFHRINNGRTCLSEFDVKSTDPIRDLQELESHKNRPTPAYIPNHSQFTLSRSTEEKKDSKFVLSTGSNKLVSFKDVKMGQDNNDDTEGEEDTVLADDIGLDADDSFESTVSMVCDVINTSDISQVPSARKDLFAASGNDIYDHSIMSPSGSRKRTNHELRETKLSPPPSTVKHAMPSLHLFRATSVESIQSSDSKGNNNSSRESSPAMYTGARALFVGDKCRGSDKVSFRSSFTGSPIAENMEEENSVSQKIRKLNLGLPMECNEEENESHFIQRNRRPDRAFDVSRPPSIKTNLFSPSLDLKEDISPKDVTGFPSTALSNSSVNLFPIETDFDSPPAIDPKKTVSHYAPPTVKKNSMQCPTSPERPHRTSHISLPPNTPSVGRKARRLEFTGDNNVRIESNVDNHSYSSSRFNQDFEILGELGNGSFGNVYKCLSRIDGCTYAVKAAKRRVKGKLDRDQMLKEVTALAALSDLSDTAAFHVVRYHQAWMEDDRLHIQTELCTSTLRMEMESGLLHKDTKRQYKLLREILLALRLIHQNNLVHLDVKPDNIFVKDGSFKLGDFGLVSKATALDVDEGDDRYMCKDLFDGNERDLTKVRFKNSVNVFSFTELLLKCTF